jgi:hypothetical protein
MKAGAIGVVRRAALDRLVGDTPGSGRAFVAAAVTGTVTAALTYRLLRSESLPPGADGE